MRTAVRGVAFTASAPHPLPAEISGPRALSRYESCCSASSLRSAGGVTLRERRAALVAAALRCPAKPTGVEHRAPEAPTTAIAEAGSGPDPARHQLLQRLAPIRSQQRRRAERQHDELAACCAFPLALISSTASVAVRTATLHAAAVAAGLACWLLTACCVLSSRLRSCCSFACLPALRGGAAAHTNWLSSGTRVLQRSNRVGKGGGDRRQGGGEGFGAATG